jgi:DNA-binding response OmpR family regulator
MLSARAGEEARVEGLDAGADDHLIKPFSAEDRRRALLAGFQVHVSKPVDPAELVATIASLLGRTGGASP